MHENGQTYMQIIGGQAGDFIQTLISMNLITSALSAKQVLILILQLIFSAF
jgi:hypothetical protein